MKNVTEKIIAFILMFVMIFNFGSVSLAEGLKLAQGKEDSLEEPVITNSNTEEEELEIVGEQIDKRKLNEKHFTLSNGSTLVAMYSENVHYEKDGKMVDIDNSLEEVQLENETVYKNKSNSYKANFAKTSKEDNELVTIESDGYKINWLMQSAQKETEIIQTEEIAEEIIEIEESNKQTKESKKIKSEENKKTEKTKEKINKVEAKVIEKEQKAKATNATNKSIEEKTNLENIASGITYENILNKIDLQYEVKAESIKESIVINDKEGLQDEFVFKFNIGELKAELQENKEVIIYKENKENYVFKIEAPYMFDSSLEYSSDIEITLDKDENTKEYILTIIPNKEWIESEERVYPITIDPTVSTSRYYDDIKDTYIFEGDESSNTRHRAHIIRIGSNNKSGPHKNPTRGLIKFTLPELNAGDQVIYASLNICSYPDTNEWAPPGREMQIDVHKMTSNWEEESAHWSNLSNLYNNIIEDYEKYTFDYNNQCKFYGFNITSIAKEWYTTGNNYGLMLKEHYEQYNYPESDAYFISANTNTAYYEGRPVVTIVYRNQTGIENYLSYHTQNVGRAGTVYTNDYNGNLVLTHQDASTPGSRFPVSINHVFNMNDKDIDIGYGKGFRLNLSQSIEFKTIDNVEYAKYIDEDGTAHYFNQDGDRYKDEDGLGLTIYRNGSTCTMEDKNRNKSTFTKNSEGIEIWYLTKVEDTEGNSINISVDLRNGKVTQVEDGANQRMYLAYDYPGRVETLTDTNGRVTRYEYNGSNLISIQYSDGKTSRYEYWNNKLTNVINIDGSKIGYEYYEERTSRVKKIQEYGSNNEIGNSLQISYGDNSTIFTDEEGYSNTIIFNNYGNAVSIADFGKENNVNGAYGKMYSYGNSGGNKNKLTLESKMISVKDMPNNLVQNPYFDNGLNNWSKNDACQNWDWVENVDNTDNKALRILGESDRYKNIKQEVYVSGNKGDIFNISSWIKTEGVPNEDGKCTKVTLNIIGNDNSSQWVDVWANTDSSSWQFLSDQFITNYDYYRIDIYLIFYLNANTTYFDNIGLFKEDFGQSYTYDDNGNVVSTQDEAKKQSEFTYTGANNLLSSISPKGGKYVYEYDYNHKNRLIKAINSTGIEYSFEYDNYGNVTSAKVTEYRKPDVPENNTKYYMKIASSNKYFDITGGSTENGTKLIQLDNISFDNQKFVLEDIGEGYYKIHPSHDLTKSLDTNTTDNEIQQWESYDTPYQAWKFIENSDGTYRVVNKYKGENYCMALKDDGKENGTQIKTESWEGKQSQKVVLYKADSDYNPIDDDKLESNEVYHIKVKSSNLYLEQAYDGVGAKVIQNTYKPNDKNQLWRVVRLDDYYYKLVNLGSLNGNVMDVLYGQDQNEQDVQMYDNTIPNPAQEWVIREDHTGVYEIGTTLSGISGAERRLTVYGNSKDAGTRMVLFTPYGGDNQQFYFEKANLLDIESGATYKIKAQQSGLIVGLDNNNMLELQNENDENAEWIIENRNDGYYKFKLKGSENKVLDVCGADTTSGTRVQVYEDTENDAQKFEIVGRIDGENGSNKTYYIKPKIGKGKKTLDVCGGYTDVGTIVYEWDTNELGAQKFELIKVESNDNRKYIETKAEYTENGNYQTKLIDTSGNEVAYEYNQNTGTLSKVTDAKENSTNYEYDGLDRVIKVSKQTNSQTYENKYTYENDRIKSITHNGTNYYFEYDTFGNIKQTKIGNQVLGTNNYESNNGLLNSFTYGNAQVISYNYDRFERLIKKTGTNGSTEYTYDAKGNVSSVKDNVNGDTESYTYDLADRLVKKENTNGYKAQYWYDGNSNLSKVTYNYGEEQGEVWYNHDRDNRVSSTGTGTDLVVNNYDRLSRLLSKEIRRNTVYTTEYTYVDTDTENKTTEKVKSIKNGNNDEISYTYDANGNIETISKGEGQEKEETNKYYYDEINQLIREDNKVLNKTIVYTYDVGGNIQSKKEYEYTQEMLTNKAPTNTINYTYGNTNWKDQLTSYSGKTITYDAIGNPLTYDRNTYTWQNGRELASITKGNTTIEYKYNDAGIRTSKTVNGVETKYYLDGSKVIYEKTEGQDIIYYFYDENVDISGLKYKGEQYYFIKNIQNDIIGILNSNLEQIVSYEYDSWGQVISIKDNNGNNITDGTNIGIINPYRYRSYRYDSETKLYYLNSRYYNPEWGRFINADGLLNSGNDLLGHNLYSYCWNNLINKTDEDGNKPGNLFTNMDAVAIDFGNYINAKSIAQNREYSSCLYSKVIRRLRIVGLKNYTIGKNTYTVPKMKIKKTMVYSYTEPKKQSKSGGRGQFSPIGTKREAILHTHAAYDSEFGIRK